MATIPKENDESTAIEATLQYLHPSSSTSAEYHASQAGDAQAAVHGGEYDSHVVWIRNGRGRQDWSLDVNGFRLVSYTPAKAVDYYDDQQLEAHCRNGYSRRFREPKRCTSLTTREDRLLLP